MIYRYGTTQRPPGPGAIPSAGLLEVSAFKKKMNIDGHSLWGLVMYTRELTDKEMENYEMVRLGGDGERVPFKSS